MMESLTTASYKHDIIELVKKYHFYKNLNEPVSNKIKYAGRVYDYEEMVNLVKASLEMWLTHGKWCNTFEKKLSKFLDIKHTLFVNSGSSANLLAFMSLTSPLLGDNRIKRGDEVITTACCFPTTVSPILMYGAVPVFVDVDLHTANIDEGKLEQALSRKTKAVMVAHTLGNPYHVRKVKDFCERHNLWLISDECDALGSTWEGKHLCHYSDISTFSFYPAHQMTTGEGGAVVTNNDLLNKIMLSLRDWGRDCTCASGQDDKCGHRFDGQHGNLSDGYDHKYVYSHAFGMNLKATEMQGAIGVAQLDKLPDFVESRRRNFESLWSKLHELDELILPAVQFSSYGLGVSPSWFGMLITLKESGIKDERVRYPFRQKGIRNKLVKYLESKGIQTRLLFSGNITKQPSFNDLELKDYRIACDLKNTDKIMNDSFWIGVYPKLTEENIKFMADTIKDFLKFNNGNEL